MDDDIWVCLMASYWRITSAIERKIREECDGAPEFLVPEITKDVLETAYLEERRIWSAGMDRLCEIYGAPEGPESHESTPLEQGVLL